MKDVFRSEYKCDFLLKAQVEENSFMYKTSIG